LQDPRKFTQIGVFGFKIYHLATLAAGETFHSFLREISFSCDISASNVSSANVHCVYQTLLQFFFFLFFFLQLLLHRTLSKQDQNHHP
jgi:hypothetical protein